MNKRINKTYKKLEDKHLELDMIIQKDKTYP